jgi:RNA polymerase sigma-70 factor (ECF subfamily)
VAQWVIPHEHRVRAWLRGSRAAPEEIDEIVQDCYCRFATIASVEHIEQPNTYFFAMARNLLIRTRKRAKVVPIETIVGLQDALIDDLPDPETTVSDRHALARLRALLPDLPARCRRILEMRKFDGLSQRDIAVALGVTESVVENDVQFGVRYLRAAWRDAEYRADQAMQRFGEGAARR